MQAFEELKCPECGEISNSASMLLKHFAEHAERSTKKSKKIPDLYPIKELKCHQNGDAKTKELKNTKKAGCESNAVQKNIQGLSANLERFICPYCSQYFRNLTDMQSHVNNTHVDFEPSECYLEFAECSLLQNLDESHSSEDKGVTTLPDLRPIDAFKSQRRKQDKSQIIKKKLTPLEVKYDFHNIKKSVLNV